MLAGAFGDDEIALLAFSFGEIMYLYAVFFDDSLVKVGRSSNNPESRVNSAIKLAKIAGYQYESNFILKMQNESYEYEKMLLRSLRNFENAFDLREWFFIDDKEFVISEIARLGSCGVLNEKIRIAKYGDAEQSEKFLKKLFPKKDHYWITCATFAASLSDSIINGVCVYHPDFEEGKDGSASLAMLYFALYLYFSEDLTFAMSDLIDRNRCYPNLEWYEKFKEECTVMLEGNEEFSAMLLEQSNKGVI